jgi:hypothetical protein
MKQKVIIGLSVVLLVAAVILIGRDLFRKSPSYTSTTNYGDDEASMKKVDSTLIGYYKTKVIETGLKDLSGIAVKENRIFVCGNSEVAVFDTSGSRTGGFHTDTANSCIAIYGNAVYVGAGSSVTGFDWAGNKKITLKSVNNKGYITSIAANQHFIFVADAINKRVLKFTTGGEFVQVIGQKDSLTGAPGFIIPSPYFDVSTGGFDDLWIVNPGRLEVENYTESGYMRSSWGEPGAEDNGFTGCCNPAHMALLPDGSFVTYEKGIDKIKLYDAAGRFKCYVGGAGSFRGKRDLQLGKNNLVKDLATDAAGNIYILDAYNTINIFRSIV